MALTTPRDLLSLAGSFSVVSKSRSLGLPGTLVNGNAPPRNGGAAPDTPTSPHPPPSAAEASSRLREARVLLDTARDHLGSFDFAESSSTETAQIASIYSGPVVVELPSEDLQATENHLLRLVDLLDIPRASVTEEDEMDAAQLLAKERFLHQTPSLLSLALSLVHLLPLLPPRPSPVSLDFRTTLLTTFARFSSTSQSPFVSPPSTAISAQLCAHLLSHPDRHSLIEHILAKSFPPLFKPHPKLNRETGRVLSRPRGGERGVLDWYEGSEGDVGWRVELGMGNVVRVVISALQRNEVEDLWPFVLPPLLAFLDDYDATNKLIGISLLDTLLSRVDGSLLRRTGVGLIFQSSLASTFTILSSHLTPALLLASHRASLTLLSLLGPTPDLQALYTLFTTGILPAWEFKSGTASIERAIAECLPPLLTAMGEGTIRFLQILVPHLCGVLGSAAEVGVGAESAEMWVAVARALEVVVRLGKRRMGRWKGEVLGAVGKCWVVVRENGGENEKLEEALRGVVEALAEGSSEIGEVDLPRLVALDAVFEGLCRFPAAVVEAQ